MRKFVSAISVILLCVSPSLALSADEPVVSPGMYEVTIGIAGNNMISEQCFPDKYVKDLQSLILTLEEPLMRNDCTVKILSETGGKAEWSMACKSNFVERTTVGSITWGKNRFNGNAVRTMGTIKIEFPFDAKRLGDCD